MILPKQNRIRLARAVVALLAIASFSVSFAIPALHRCPKIGSISSEGANPAAFPSHCHRSGEGETDRHYSAATLQRAGFFASNRAEESRHDRASKNSQGHDHETCPICQGYLSLQNMTAGGSFFFLLSFATFVFSAIAPSSCFGVTAPILRARGPPSILSSSS